MDPITTLAEANRAQRAYFMTAAGALADDTRDVLDTLLDAPVRPPALVDTAELLFARRDELDNAGRELVIGLAGFAFNFGLFALGRDDRASRVIAAMRRDIEAGAVVTDDGDPVPEERFAREVDTPVASVGEG